MRTPAASARRWPRKWLSKIPGLVGKGWKINVVTADHQNKPDIGTNIVREWFDQGKADVIVDSLNSGVVAGGEPGRQGKEQGLPQFRRARRSDLTGKACTPNLIHWAYDTYALANGTGKAMTKAGGTSWFFITADYAFGKALERDTTAVVVANGGKVLGDVLAPLNSADFSSQLLQAQASKAKVIGLANAGADTANSIKQAAEFGLDDQRRPETGRAADLPHRHPLARPAAAQGLEYTTTFYWDLNDGHPRLLGAFLQALEESAPCRPWCRRASIPPPWIISRRSRRWAAMPPDGAASRRQDEVHADRRPGVRQGHASAQDGRAMHPAYLMQVKKPAEIEMSLGLLETRRDHSGGRGFPAAVAKPVPAGEEVTARQQVGRANPPLPAEHAGKGQRARSCTAGRPDPHDSPARHLHPGVVRAIAGRPDQRRLLRPAEPRPRRDLRHVQHRQFRPWRALHDGRLLRLVPAQLFRHRLLAGPGAGAAGRRRCSAWRSSGPCSSACPAWTRSTGCC